MTDHIFDNLDGTPEHPDHAERVKSCESRVISVPVVLVDEESEPPRVSSTPSNSGPVKGDWYWLKNEDYGKRGHEDEAQEFLVCAVKVGSNFVKVVRPHHRYGSSWRVHLRDFWTDLRHEPNAEQAIRANIERHQEEMLHLMAEVRALTQRLGLTPATELENGVAPVARSNELAVLSSQNDIKTYGSELVLAKEKTLPALHQAIKDATEKMATWMKAPSLPMEAAHDALKESIGDIDSRIFSISLYAGLAEQSVQIAKGEPAELTEKLAVMQRMLFMDEEALLAYDAGGMEFKDIGEFDNWLSKPENRDRILPFPRTLVAMRVRRNLKEREVRNLMDVFIKMSGEISDKATFLYVRNGENLHRLDCEMDFGELIFPDRTLYDPQEPKMVEMGGYNACDEMMTVSEYESRVIEYKQLERDYKAWKRANPNCKDWDSPYRAYTHSDFRPDDWKPVDHSNVYFDECMLQIEKKVTEFNRIALIIQGLFDRSMVLHPHLPVQSWSKEGFDRAIRLVMDGVDVLHHGEAPDFEAYRAQCNASLGEGSVTVGQEEFWLAKEAVKECARLDRDYRSRGDYRPKRFQPYGNPGPGVAATVVKWSPRSKTAQFTWEKEKRGGWRGETVTCNLSVPAAELFNVSAYRQGDYKQFFVDPRTRAQYLKWAPMLLAAEDYLAGKSGGSKRKR